MQIMTKINYFEEIFFEGSIIFHIFAPKEKEEKSNSPICFSPLFLSATLPRQGKRPENKKVRLLRTSALRLGLEPRTL